MKIIKHVSRVTRILGLLYISAIPLTANAWIPFPCENGTGQTTGYVNDTITYGFLVDTQPYNANFTSAISQVAAAYRNVGDSNFRVFITPRYGDTKVNISPNNGNTMPGGIEMGFEDFDALGLSSNAIAVAYVYRDGCEIIGTDVLFDKDRKWNAGKYQGGSAFSEGYSISQTALHEIGHSLGLKHQQGLLSAMNSIYPFGGGVGVNNDATPLVDDVRAIRVIYPSNTPVVRDLISSRYKANVGAVVRNNVKSTGTNSTQLAVRRGQTYNIEFSIENHGTTSANNVDVGVYLSNDKSISPSSDVFLGGFTANFGYGATMPGIASVTIPSGVALGNYYIGVYVDSSNNHSTERDENNNISLVTTSGVSYRYLVTN